MHNHQRSSITAIVAIATALALVLATSVPVEAQIDPQIPWPNGAAKTSPHIQGWSTNTFASTYNQLKARTATGETLRNAATAAHVLFGHFSETGLTKELEDQILQNQEAVLAFTPSSQQIQSMQYELERNGMALTYGQVQSLLNVPIDRRKAAISYLQQHGLAYIHQRIVHILNNHSYVLENHLTGNLRLASAPLRLVDDDCKAFQQIIDTILLVAALNGTGCLFGCLPCCGIAAGAALIGGTLQFFKDMVC